MRNKHITKCQLDTGSIVEYDACSEHPDAYDNRVFLHIGQGVIYSINGIRQITEQKLHFWVYKTTFME